MDGVNKHFEKIADFLKKIHGFSGSLLEQFLYNINRKAQNQEMPRAFHGIRESNQKSVTKSKGFFTQTSHVCREF